MLYQPSTRSVSLALGRLRMGIILSSWVIGLSLFAQLIIWSMATFTEMRWEIVEETVEVPLVVGSGAAMPVRQSLRKAGEDGAANQPLAPLVQVPSTTTEPVCISSRHDRTFASVVNVTGAAGRCAAVVLLALIGLGVLLAANTAVSGTDRTVSAFLWAVLVAIIILPLGGAFALPWSGGALSTYENMTAWVDHISPPPHETAISEAAPNFEGGTIMFYLQFGLLPVVAIVGVTLIGLRFCSAVELALLPREDQRIDPALEREAANISPSSLHGGRTGDALKRTLVTAPNGEDRLPSATQLSPGNAPKRLI
jgi:hypothetical protein